jgi:serine protease AprX
MYCSSFGHTADGILKPELLAPAIWVPAPLMPETRVYQRAEALWTVASAPRYAINRRARQLWEQAELPDLICEQLPPIIRAMVERTLKQHKIIHPKYQHVDGTSFAAPIVTSIVAQMLEANPKLTPDVVKHILTSTAHRVPYFPRIRQGFGILDAKEAVSEALKERVLSDHKVVPSPLVEDGSLVFAYYNENANKVTLAGDFNDWSAETLQLIKDAAGVWRVTVPPPPPGRYRYKYILDGHNWIDDPGNGVREPDGYKGFNSVLKISD